MEPRSVMISEQKTLMRMLCLDAEYDTIITDGESCIDTTLNMIEVLSDTATLTSIERYVPQNNAWSEEANLYELNKGVYFGYFRNIVVADGLVRLLSW